MMADDPNIPVIATSYLEHYNIVSNIVTISPLRTSKISLASNAAFKLTDVRPLGVEPTTT